MSHSTHQPFNYSTLARLLKRLRSKHKLSINQLAKLSDSKWRASLRAENRKDSLENRVQGSAFDIMMS